MNAVCPINYGSAGDLISIKYQEEHNTVLMYYSLNEEYSSHVFLKQNKNNMMKQFRLSLSNDNSRQMLKDMVNAKASLMIIYKSPSSGKSIKFTLPYDELKEIKEHPLSESEIMRMMLENSVAMQNSSLPKKYDNGIVLTKVSIVDYKLIYYYEMDENIYNLTDIKNSQAELEDDMKEDLIDMQTDRKVQQDLKTLNALNMGYMHRYYGNSSKKFVDVELSSDELSRYIIK